MRRVVQHRKVSRQFLSQGGNVDMVPRPPATWVMRGPRGGHYLATGARERRVGEVGDDFMRNQLTVMDYSEGARYLRPAQARKLMLVR